MPSSRVTKGSPASVPYLWNGQSIGKLAASQAPFVAERELQESYDRGYRDGESVAKKSRVEGVLEQLGETIESLATTRAALFHSAQSDVLRLAMAIARRILHRELLISPDALGGIIVVVLERLEDQDVHRVRVHPSMVVRIEELLISRTGRRKVQVVSDETLSLGGCVFETQHGAVNAGIESQLSEIERGLADQLEGSR